jgi:hypothetical protein
VFEAFAERMLVLSLRPGQSMILDTRKRHESATANALIYRVSQAVAQLTHGALTIRSVGCWLLTDRGRQNVHLAAVLGDGATGDADPVIQEAVTDLGVAERGPRGALVADDLLNHVFDAE